MGWDPVGFTLRWPSWGLAAVGRKFCLCPLCLRPPTWWLAISEHGPDNLCPHGRQRTRGRECSLWFQVRIETEGETHVVSLVTHSMFVQADTGPVKTAKTQVWGWLRNRPMGPMPVFYPPSPPFMTAKPKTVAQNTVTERTQWLSQGDTNQNHNTQKTSSNKNLSPVNLNFHFFFEKMRGSCHFLLNWTASIDARVWG